MPRLTIGASNYNVSGFYNERTPVTQIFVNNTNQFGRHTLKFGTNLEYTRSGSTQAVANAGNFTFTAAGTPAGTNVFTQAFAQFLQGRVSNFTQASNDIASSSHLNIYEGYGQDSWKVTPRLTLIGGVRYTYFAAASNDTFEGRSFLPLLNFDPSQFNAANAPALQGDAARSGNAGICTAAPCYQGDDAEHGLQPAERHYHRGSELAVWERIRARRRTTILRRGSGSPMTCYGNGTTAVRGGYGVYYFSLIGNPSKFATNQNPPNVQNTTIQNAPFANPGSERGDDFKLRRRLCRLTRRRAAAPTRSSTAWTFSSRSARGWCWISGTTATMACTW